MVGSLGCPWDGFVHVHIISALYVIILIYSFHLHHWDMLMPATTFLSHAGISPHYLGGKWSLRTPGVGGRTSSDLRHGTGHQPAPHHPLKYSIPVSTCFSLNLKYKLLTGVSISLKYLQFPTISSSSDALRLPSPSNYPPNSPHP